MTQIDTDLIRRLRKAICENLRNLWIKSSFCGVAVSAARGARSVSPGKDRTTPSPAGRKIAHKTRFGQGYVVYEHVHDGMEVELLAFVPAQDPAKLMRLRVRNHSGEVRRMSVPEFRGLKGDVKVQGPAEPVANSMPSKAVCESSARRRQP